MNRTPYHLTSPTEWATASHQSQHYHQAKDVMGRQGARTPPLMEPQSPPSTEHENPIFQPQFGSAHRYGASRSMMPQHTSYESTAVDSDPTHNPWNHVHPLQSNPNPIPQSHMPQMPLHSKQKVEQRSIASILKKQILAAVKTLQDPEEPESFYGQSQKPTEVINRQRLRRLLAPCILLVLANFMGILPTRLFRRSTAWDRLEERHLNGRQCVMNLFVDKHEANEFNPDFDPTLDKDHLHRPQPMEGTYRTKGQVEVINRFISSVAAAFRPNVSVQQHVVFTGTRDGGHLAHEALKHWPARGSYRTQLHVFADVSSDELDYETVQSIEDRFKGDEEDVHIYDNHGNVAGGEDENDDDGLDKQLPSKQRAVTDKKYDALPDMKRIIFDPDEEEDSVIPYLHIDGTSMEMQMAILAQTEHLLEDHKIVVVGLEHTPDLDVNELIEFFRRLNYKTFMLGLRQLTRIDNLCPEILDNVMEHPTLAASSAVALAGGSAAATASSWFGDESKNDSGRNPFRMPPFFVAMPRGRHSKEEMGIQHMYDLFSGASGLLQVKTANDRVAVK